MTDKELLELAAKAAGRTIKYNYLGTQDARWEWNPLEDDGDALRLAVKLGLRIYTPHEDDRIAVVRDYEGLYISEIGEDYLAITRRAIVRAASEIGRGME